MSKSWKNLTVWQNILQIVEIIDLLDSVIVSKDILSLLVWNFCMFSYVVELSQRIFEFLLNYKYAKVEETGRTNLLKFLNLFIDWLVKALLNERANILDFRP